MIFALLVYLFLFCDEPRSWTHEGFGYRAVSYRWWLHGVPPLLYGTSTNHSQKVGICDFIFRLCVCFTVSWGYHPCMSLLRCLLVILVSYFASISMRFPLALIVPCFHKVDFWGLFIYLWGTWVFIPFTPGYCGVLFRACSSHCPFLLSSGFVGLEDFVFDKVPGIFRQLGLRLVFPC